MAQQLTWQELRDSVDARVRELNSHSGSGEETDVPYYTVADIDTWLYEAVLITLRTFDQKEGEEADPQIVQTLSYSPPVAFPQNILKIFGVSEQTGPILTPTGYVPATELAPVNYQQIQSSTAAYIACYSLFNGQIWSSNVPGATTQQPIRVVVVVQPLLTDLVTGTIIPPCGHDEEWIDYAHKRMLAQDLMPAGRM